MFGTILRGGNGEDTTYWLQTLARFPLLFGVEELKYLLMPATLLSTECTVEGNHVFLVVVMHRRRDIIIIDQPVQ